MSGHKSTWKYGGRHVTKVCGVRLPNGEICGREHEARDMCLAHYQRVKRTGDPQAHIPIGGPPPIERFAAKIEKQGEHWIWQGSTNAKGYAQFSVDDRLVLAHRWAWEQANGEEIPDDMQCLHYCDTPQCVYPHHLYIGTSADNQEDREFAEKEYSIFRRKLIRIYS